ncbi:MAG TPA: PPC domain-containing DNA-binding protein [Patescibacteria group bacterium]
MQYTKVSDGYLIRLKIGDKFVENLLKFAEEVGLHAGFFQAIGSLKEAELGFYHLDKKEYEFKSFSGDRELVNLTGNVSLVDGKPFVHMHCVLANENFSTIGGHLKEGTSGATCEIYFVPFQKDIERVMDDEVGLKLLDCV